MFWFCAGLPSIECLADDLDSANQYFQNGEYVEARSAYLELAKQRYKFAQYRVGLIDYFGLAGDVDKVSAYAWISVAAAPFVPILMQIESIIDDELSHSQRRKARDLAARHHQDYAQKLVHGHGVARRSDRQCTGSRLGKGCERLDIIGANNPSLVHDQYESRGSRRISQDDLDAFNRAYSDFIFEEFSRFDRASREAGPKHGQPEP